MKSMIRIASLLVLVAVISFNVAPAMAAAAAESDTPCTDMWAGCMAGGGSSEFCEGMWCACMYRNYGYICGAQS